MNLTDRTVAILATVGMVVGGVGLLVQADQLRDERAARNTAVAERNAFAHRLNVIADRCHFNRIDGSALCPPNTFDGLRAVSFSSVALTEPGHLGVHGSVYGADGDHRPTPSLTGGSARDEAGRDAAPHTRPDRARVPVGSTT